MENFEQIEQEETLPPQPSSKKKYLLIGVIAAAFAVLIGGTVIFALIQNNVPSLPKVTEPETLPVDPIAIWQTYRNDTYGFEVKYPKEWDAEQNELLAGVYLFFNQDVEDFQRDFKYTEDSLVFSIAVRKESTDPTKHPLFKRLKQLEQGQNFVEIRPVTEERIVYTKVRDEFISNIPAVRYQNNEGEIDFSKGLFPRDNTVLLLKDDLAFIFAFQGGSQENVDKNKVVFDQILSTFRFIE